MIGNKYNGYSQDGRRLYCKGGDGGAGAAREQEDARQRRIQAAVNKINGIFDSRPMTNGVNAATSFDPSKTYYDADGNVFALPDLPNFPDLSNGMEADLRGQLDAKRMAQVNEMIGSGQLFTGVETTTPATTRQQLYDDQKTAVFDINKRDIDKQYGDAERAARFGLARSGLSGGSEDIDVNAKLQDKTNEGLMKATGIADSAAADLKMADERQRQGLISMAQSGIDTGTAQQSALRALDATAQTAAGNRQAATIGGLFDDLGKAYVINQGIAGTRSGNIPGNQWYGVSAPQQTYSGTTR